MALSEGIPKNGGVLVGVLAKMVNFWRLFSFPERAAGAGPSTCKFC